MPPLSHSFRLVPFVAPGAAPPTPAIEISGSITLQPNDVEMIYQISGATQRVKYMHAATAPQRTDELWRTTCFELFLKLPTDVAYWEYNLAPSGNWAVYRFTGYRSELQAEPRINAINIATAAPQERLEKLRATLPLPPPLVGQPLAVGISSVIEDHDGNIYYFALRHGVKPDFHDPAGFSLALAPL